MEPKLETCGTTKRLHYPPQSFGRSFCGAGVFVSWSFPFYPSRPNPPAMQAAFARRLRVDPSATFSRLKFRRFRQKRLEKVKSERYTLTVFCVRRTLEALQI